MKMRYSKILLFAIIIGAVNLMIYFILPRLMLGNNDPGVFMVKLQEYISVYFILISGIATVVMIVLTLIKLKKRKNYNLIALSLILNALYAVLYYDRVKNFFASIFS